jgi:hypothetical protein
MPKFITTDQIADRFGYAAGYVYGLAMDEEFPRVRKRLGRFKLYSVGDVKRYFANRVDGRTREGKALKRRKRR